MKNRSAHSRDFLMGNLACAEGALAAGCQFYAGYPITPASEIMQHMSGRIFQEGGTFLQTEDEIAAMASVIGASWGGAKAMTATCGPGISLMQENIGLAVMTETPCVIVNVQRGGPSTGSTGLSSQGDLFQVKYGSQGDYPVIAIAPSSPQEMYEHTIWAFNKSEKYRTPVFVLSDRLVGHMSESVDFYLPEDINIENRKIREKYDGPGQEMFLSPEGVAPMPVFGRGLKAHVTGSSHYPDGSRNVADAELMDYIIKTLKNKIERSLKDISLTEKEYMEDAEIAVVSWGSTFRSCLSAVKDCRSMGLPAGSFRPVTVWPFPENEIREISEKVKTIIVCENNMGQLYHMVRSAALDKAKVVFLPPEKLGTLIKPARIVEKVREAL